MKKTIILILAVVFTSMLFVGYGYAGVWEKAKTWVTGEVLALVLSLVLLRKPLAQSQRTAGRAGLQMRGGQGARSFAPMRRGGLTIGRDPRSGMALTDDKVSANHAQIRKTNGEYVIYDLGSTNGTYVNGQRVSQHVLRDGDEIRVGDTELVFRG